jgi:hypothetical protein
MKYASLVLAAVAAVALSGCSATTGGLFSDSGAAPLVGTSFGAQVNIPNILPTAGTAVASVAAPAQFQTTTLSAACAPPPVGVFGSHKVRTVLAVEK